MTAREMDFSPQAHAAWLFLLELYSLLFGVEVDAALAVRLKLQGDHFSLFLSLFSY